jgi:hypothetical protein
MIIISQLLGAKYAILFQDGIATTVILIFVKTIFTIIRKLIFVQNRDFFFLPFIKTAVTV